MLIRLRTFVEVYRQRSISGAARALDLTQPAISQHVASLEGAIGRQLFERHAQGVTPTAAADELAKDIGDRLDLAEAALATARARSAAMAGAVRIIGHADFLSEMIAPLLVPLLETGMRVRLETANHDGVMHSLVEGHCDLGLSASPINDRRLRSELVHCERVIAVAAPAVAARIAAAGDLVTALASEPVLAYNIEQSLIDEWLETNRLHREPVSPALVAPDLRGLRALLGVGFGWTVLPIYLCAAELARGDLVEIPAPIGPGTNSYFLVWLPAALRQPRIAHARQTLIRQLRHDLPLDAVPA
ncbi:LysR family transcriptional regulator [Novosphingobium sp. FSW06-99]|uniref:LysR family transcriptional regulator n=1 Tax=Novosphingobium sp. FSW06-99 TaxID=1739113 RepID=UPI00076BE2A4|nr:LysR family transcriptional regulator [Novosphingobium sp. FSW06-99]KUR76375.1 LysR family transcriptional regulator [Novosphingobium sp. FSW06-99]